MGASGCSRSRSLTPSGRWEREREQTLVRGCNSKEIARVGALDDAATNQVSCEPPTHRSVLKGSSPPPHHPRECRPEPPLSAPVGGGSRLHRPSGASLASDDQGGQSLESLHNNGLSR